MCGRALCGRDKRSERLCVSAKLPRSLLPPMPAAATSKKGDEGGSDEVEIRLSAKI